MLLEHIADIKPDHEDALTGEPCGCEDGDDRWTRTAMHVPAGGEVRL